jgi:hypothetical protein
MSYRAIHDDVPHSDSLNQVSDFAERLYWRMLAVSDDCGRGPGTVQKIASLCIPRLAKAPEDVRDALEELVRADRIALGLVKGIWAFEIIDFNERQPIAQSKAQRVSRYPSPLSADLSMFQADAVPLFDADAVPVDHPHAVVDSALDAVPAQQLRVGSGQNRTEERKGDKNNRPERASTEATSGLAGLSTLSLSEIGKALESRSVPSDPLQRLLDVLPDRDRNTEQVLRRLLETLPDHAADHARRELEDAQQVRSPVKYVVGILRNWNEKGIAAA